MWVLAMRGDDVRTDGLFAYVSCEGRVPGDHPLRRILPLVDAALSELSGEFAGLYAPIGRPSIPPEKLLRALLLQAFYSVRSERQLMEQLDYNLLFRWFVGLGIDDPIWDVTVFTKNRDRLLKGDIAARFFRAVLGQPEVKALLSDDHFTVDGTLIEAWASMKSFKPKDVRRQATGGWRWPQRRARLPRRAAQDSEPRLDHRSRCPPDPPGRGKKPSSATWATS
jgi:transposase